MPGFETCTLTSVPGQILSRRAEWCLALVETCADESHDMRGLLQCRECGQLYWRDWHEEIDWQTGDDSSWETFVRVSGEDDIVRLLVGGPLALGGPVLNNSTTSGRRGLGWSGAEQETA